jgi:hypothetical protein
MVPVVSKGVSPAPPYSGYSYVVIRYSYGAITRYGHSSQSVRINITSKKKSYNPKFAVTKLVWAVPLSLATTCGITIVFSSCRYLDVSVPCVCLLCLAQNISTSSRWVAPFGYLRINVSVQLPVAFRSLARPSSPPRA